MPERLMNVLVVGKDARTDVIAELCRRSPLLSSLSVCAEFNIPGLIEKSSPNCFFRIDSLTDVSSIMDRVREIGPDLVIVGPEEPLAAGLVDALTAARIPSFGPNSSLARIESSKIWARSLLDRYDVPGRVANMAFTSEVGIRDFMERLGDIVVKPDGLTGGKGVRVLGDHLDTLDEAYEYARELVEQFGSVSIEERLDGEEFSLQTITDGASVVHCPLVQDHKRAEEGDAGPNTGGMGSYSCPDFSLPFLTAGELAKARFINERVIEAIHAETGSPYRGVLYGGFMATGNDIRVIEYNARFGDPEAMNVLPLLENDFIELCYATAQGELDQIEVRFSSKATVCKYVVPATYPTKKLEGDEIKSPDRVLSDQLRRYWAATELRDDGSVRLTGSRAVAFVGIADTLDEAERLAEHGASSVEGPVRHRSDIGSSDLVASRVRHMDELRRQASQR